MDPLTDLLARALRTAYWSQWDEGTAPAAAEAVIAAIDPDKADAMRAGLLLGEATQAVQRIRQRAWMVEVIDWGYEPGSENPINGMPTKHKGRWQASAQHSWQLRDEPEWGEVEGSGDSPLAALTDLLAKLRVQP